MHETEINQVIQRIINRIMNHEGANPTRNPAYWLATVCPKCNRHFASNQAFELSWGQGTNLCWGDCERETLDMIAVPELMPLVKHYLELVNQKGF